MPRKKKTEEAGEEKTEEKVNEDKEGKAEKEGKTEGKTEEFPDVDFGIDVFSQVPKAEEQEEAKKKLKEELKKKAAKLAEKIEIKDERKIKEEVEKEAKEAKKRKRAEKTLFPLDDYVRYSAHLGTKAVTPQMRKYVYRRRADGIAVLNTNSIDGKLKEAVDFLKDFKPEDIFLACKREAGWPATLKFGEVTGIRVFTKKYPAGVITNTRLENFFETELVIICDPWLDKNALNDANIVKRPVISLCDTNNLTTGVTKIVPCNNKSGKSLGLILYLLAREYLKATGKEAEAKKLNMEDFTGMPEEESSKIKEAKVTEKESEKAKVTEKETEKESEVEKVSMGAEEGV